MIVHPKYNFHLKKIQWKSLYLTISAKLCFDFTPHEKKCEGSIYVQLKLVSKSQKKKNKHLRYVQHTGAMSNFQKCNQFLQ